MQKLIGVLCLTLGITAFTFAGGSSEEERVMENTNTSVAESESNSQEDKNIDKELLKYLTPGEQELVEAYHVGDSFPVTLTEEEWRSRLDDFQYNVLREHGTERAFHGTTV